MVAALGGDLHQVSDFVNRKKNKEIHVKWFLGYVEDPRNGKLKHSCYLDPAPDPSTGEMMREIDNSKTYNSDFKPDFKDADDFKLGDIKVHYKGSSDEMGDWVRHTPVLFVVLTWPLRLEMQCKLFLHEVKAEPSVFATPLRYVILHDYLRKV